MEAGKMSKKDVMQVIYAASGAKLRDKTVPEEKRKSFARNLISDYTTIEQAKGDTLADIKKYASEAKASNHTKSLISGIAGLTVSLLGMMAAGVIFKRPEFAFAILPGFIGIAVGNAYASNSIADSKTEKVAAYWENFFIEQQKEQDDAAKKAIESIPIAGAGCVRSVA